MPVAFLTHTTEAARASPAAIKHVASKPNTAVLTMNLRIIPQITLYPLGLETMPQFGDINGYLFLLNLLLVLQLLGVVIHSLPRRQQGSWCRPGCDPLLHREAAGA